MLSAGRRRRGAGEWEESGLGATACGATGCGEGLELLRPQRMPAKKPPAGASPPFSLVESH